MFQTAICFDKKVQIKMRVRSENNGILKNIRNFAAKQKGYMIMTDEMECATCNTNHSSLNLKPPNPSFMKGGDYEMEAFSSL